MTVTTTETECRYCAPKGQKITSKNICDRHALLFEKLDELIWGDDILAALAHKHDRGHSVVFNMGAPAPTLRGRPVGVVIETLEVGDMTQWTVRDFNGNHWRGESKRKAATKFRRVDLTTEPKL